MEALPTNSRLELKQSASLAASAVNNAIANRQSNESRRGTRSEERGGFTFFQLGLAN